MFRYRLNDTEGGFVCELEHPAPNLEPGDVVTSPDGKRWRILRYVPAPEDAPIHRLLEVEWHE